MRIDPVTDRHAANDRAEIEITRRHGRRTEHIFRVQHSHHQRCERDHQHERPHDPGEQNRELGFVRRPTSPRQQIHQLRREHDAEQRDRAHEHGRERGDLVRQAPRRLIAFDRDLFRERGDERRRKRALGEEIAQQIRQPKRHEKRVEISSGAEQPGKHHLANQTEQAARQNGNADHTRRAGAHSPVISRSHRRTFCRAFL